MGMGTSTQSSARNERSADWGATIAAGLPIEALQGDASAYGLSWRYRIEPALIGLPEKLKRDEKILEGVKRNVQLTVRRLSRVPDLMRSLRKDHIKIVGAIYDMDTGKVTVLDEPSATSN